MADKSGAVILVVILILAGIYVIPKIDFSKFSILPELDNRINYFDEATDVTQTIQTSLNVFENDKFIGEGNIALTFSNTLGMTSDNGQSMRLIPKKDFSRLKLYIRYLAYGGNLFITSGTGANLLKFNIGIDDKEYHNFEIVPDNLNIGIYDIYKDGEFKQRIDTEGNPYILYFSVGGGDKFVPRWIAIDYIKYVPPETFSIKNDEVWVKEVRGSDYSVANLNWEMLGYHSEIRPATIRDLTAQTEVPTPQIYINLINGLPVSVAPNTVHTFYYKTKWTAGLDSSCQGQLDKVEIKVGDTWVCDSYVKETPIIQQCQTLNDCPILPECEAQRNLISCNNNLCDYTQFSPACKNQLITYQEKVTEIENTKFVPIVSGTNSFFCFFDKTQSSCNIGEKTISITSPSNACSREGSEITTDSKCFKTTITFNEKDYIGVSNGNEIIVDYNIKITPSIGATFTESGLRDNWGIVVKGTLPDDFLEIKPKELGNKFILKDSTEKASFIITNKLFGIDGGYTIQTTNTALQGGVVLRDEVIPLYLKVGDNEVTYDIKTQQFGTIVDLIGTFGKVTTDREYILKSSQDGKQKFLVVTKEVVDILPQDIEKVQPEIIEKTIIVEKEVIKEIPFDFKDIPPAVWVIGGIIVFFIILRSL